MGPVKEEVFTDKREKYLEEDCGKRGEVIWVSVEWENGFQAPENKRGDHELVDEVSLDTIREV